MKSREAAAFPCLLCHITASFASFIMFCSSVTLRGDHAHCVLQRVNHRAQVFARRSLQVRQIQNQTASACTGHGARKHSTRRVLSELPVAICLKSGNRRLHLFQRIVMVTVVLCPLTICASLYCFSAFKISLFYPSVMKQCIRSRLLFTLFCTNHFIFKHFFDQNRKITEQLRFSKAVRYFLIIGCCRCWWSGASHHDSRPPQCWWPRQVSALRAPANRECLSRRNCT